MRELIGSESVGEVFEFVTAALLEILDQCSEARTEELQAVFEDDVTAPVEGQVLLDPLRHDCYLSIRVAAERANDQMRVVSSEVVEEDGDSEALLQAQVALVMCRSSKRAGDVAVISNLDLKKRGKMQQKERKKNFE